MNPEKANKTLNNIRDYFSSSEFLFTDPDQVQIIDGKEEGLFAWVSTNYFIDSYSSVRLEFLCYKIK